MHKNRLLSCASYQGFFLPKALVWKILLTTVFLMAILFPLRAGLTNPFFPAASRVNQSYSFRFDGTPPASIGSASRWAKNESYRSHQKTNQNWIDSAQVPFPSSLPKGQRGHPYEGHVFAGAHHSDYPFRYDYSTGMPPGMHIDADNGSILGVPTKAGTYPVYVYADSYGTYPDVELYYSIVVEESNCPTIMLPTSVPAMFVSTPYQASFAAGPAGSYTYSYTTDNYTTLAKGLTFDTKNGTLTGIPEATHSFYITVRATDGKGCANEKQYYMRATCLMVFPPVPTQAQVGVYYHASINPTNVPGPFSYEYIGIPAGLMINTATGEVSGIPTQAGTFNIRIFVYGACLEYNRFTLTIAPAVPCNIPNRGSIIRETWVKIKGYDVRTIPVTTIPTATRQLTRFEGPSNVTSEYGDRIRGYIYAPISGNYTFWIASDDNSVLYLSSDDQSVNKQRIAWVNGATQPREWSKYASQKSAPIYLEACKKYYIETLHKEVSNDDHLSVGWQLPAGELERPIPGKRLSPFQVPVNARLTEIEEVSLALKPSLSAAPNPFSDHTTLRFTAQTSGRTSIAVYSLTGNLVKVLFEGELQEGATKEWSLEGAALPSGVYLVKATSPAGVSYLKLILTK